MVKRKDLVDVGDENYHQRQNEVMQCQDCNELIGGTRGDYWHLPMEHIFECPTCGSTNLHLVTPVTYYKKVD
jgi:Zn finger protein HypA/HybF involved in hydrogenase expression